MFDDSIDAVAGGTPVTFVGPQVGFRYLASREEVSLILSMSELDVCLDITDETNPGLLVKVVK